MLDGKTMGTYKGTYLLSNFKFCPFSSSLSKNARKKVNFFKIKIDDLKKGKNYSFRVNEKFEDHYQVKNLISKKQLKVLFFSLSFIIH